MSAICFNLDQSKISLSGNVLNLNHSSEEIYNVTEWSVNVHQDAGNGLTLSQMTNFRLFQTERVCRQQFQI